MSDIITCPTPATIDLQDVALFGDGALDFNGVKYEPDETRGYFKFRVSHSFPATTYYGTALHPNVVAMSYKSMLHQNLNYEHNIREYHKGKGDKNYVEDRIIGSIVDVNFSRPPSGGFRVGKEPIPIEGVAVFFKQATAMQKVIGEHQTGRHKYTVSMEVQYPLTEAGFAVAHNGKPEFKNNHAPDMLDAGAEFVPWSEASDELKSTFSREKNRISKKFKNRATYLMMGGLNNPVHYAGLGVVRYGAEPTAEIVRMAASDNDAIVEPFRELAEALEKIFAKSC